MGGLFDDQEKTEEPTSRALEQAREKGNVARSEQLGGSVTLAAASLVLLVLGGVGAEHLRDVMLWELQNLPTGPMEMLDALHRLRGLGPTVASISGPFVLVVLLVALAVQWLQTGGPMWVTETLTPKIQNLSPMKGIKKIFSLRSVVKTGMALVRLVAILSVVLGVLHLHRKELQDLALVSIEVGIARIARLAIELFLCVSLLLCLLAVVDYLYQRWQWQKSLRMTKQQVRDEHKDTEGNPEIKKRVRSRRMQVFRASMRQAVSEATVVVTNPTHFAVALRYPEDGKAPPSVVAKGVDRVAFRIRELARELRVPVLEQPSLARTLFRDVPVGAAIPERLYRAVAKVIATVYRLQSRRRARLQGAER